MVKPAIDTQVTDDYKRTMRWKKASEGEFPYNHSRHLPSQTAQKALDYIAEITKKYPFQIRYSMAKPLWARFAQEWCNTGDEEKALRVI